MLKYNLQLKQITLLHKDTHAVASIPEPFLEVDSNFFFAGIHWMIARLLHYAKSLIIEPFIETARNIKHYQHRTLHTSFMFKYNKNIRIYDIRKTCGHFYAVELKK